jgi:tellurite resistance-related uncharacterized protein
MTWVLVCAALEAYREEGEGDHIVSQHNKTNGIFGNWRLMEGLWGYVEYVKDVENVQAEMLFRECFLKVGQQALVIMTILIYIQSRRGFVA